MCAPLLDRSWYKQVRIQQESAGRHSLLTCRRTNFRVNSKLLSVHAYASVTAVLTAMVSVILLPCPFSLINFIESCSMGGKSHSGPRDAGGIFVWLFWVPRSSSAEGHYTLAAIAWVQITILRPLIVIMKEDTATRGTLLFLELGSSGNLIFATPLLNNCKNNLILPLHPITVF